MGTLIVRRPDQANETLNFIGEQFTVLAAGEDTGSYEVFVQMVPPGAGPPLHSHPGMRRSMCWTASSTSVRTTRIYAPRLARSCTFPPVAPMPSPVAAGPQLFCHSHPDLARPRSFARATALMLSLLETSRSCLPCLRGTASSRLSQRSSTNNVRDPPWLRSFRSLSALATLPSTSAWTNFG
jgi:hypothetical protein